MLSRNLPGFQHQTGTAEAASLLAEKVPGCGLSGESQHCEAAPTAEPLGLKDQEPPKVLSLRDTGVTT